MPNTSARHRPQSQTVCTTSPRPATIGMLSTYPPTQCGLATFSAALIDHLHLSPGSLGIVRVLDNPEPCSTPDVVSHLLNGSEPSTIAAIETLNSFDAVIVQHEYGIYGGPDGRDVLDVVEALTVPTIIVLHTVLTDPTPAQRHILLRLLAAADVVVTMTTTARRRLITHYAADPTHVTVIPHGAIDHGAMDRGKSPDPHRVGTRPVILTWGLIGPGKGIEWAIDALVGLRDLRPRYRVIGQTHPKVVQRDGEAYRTSLIARARTAGVADLLELDARYPTVDELAALVQQADVVLLPYDSREQVTSGVLIEAVAAGRPVVSTAFPHAIELLADDTGIVVPQRNPAAIETALRRVLTEPGLAEELAEQAARKAPELLWSAVANRYRSIASALVTADPTQPSMIAASPAAALHRP